MAVKSTRLNFMRLQPLFEEFGDLLMELSGLSVALAKINSSFTQDIRNYMALNIREL
jgi:hypothetical protein